MSAMLNLQMAAVTIAGVSISIGVADQKMPTTFPLDFYKQLDAWCTQHLGVRRRNARWKRSLPGAYTMLYTFRTASDAALFRLAWQGTEVP